METFKDIELLKKTIAAEVTWVKINRLCSNLRKEIGLKTDAINLPDCTKCPVVDCGIFIKV